MKELLHNSVIYISQATIINKYMDDLVS
jgi:hypothetical protein